MLDSEVTFYDSLLTKSQRHTKMTTQKRCSCLNNAPELRPLARRAKIENRNHVLSKSSPCLMKPAAYEHISDVKVVHNATVHNRLSATLPPPPKMSRKCSATTKSIKSTATSSSEDTASTVSEDIFRRLQIEDSAQIRESVDKCLKWMKDLPPKFSGLNTCLPLPAISLRLDDPH